MIESHTIFSLSSGAGMAGIAVIRISGPKAFLCVEKMCKTPVLSRRANLRTLYHPENQSVLDEGLVIKFDAPQTFTGENIVEFQIHGGRATVAAVLAALDLIDGYSQAEPGEFTRRAFVNGRLDLIEIEGLGDLIHAETDVQRKQALAQAQGIASEIFENWRKDITRILAYYEASIDFVDEDDVDERALENLTKKLIQLRNEMSRHLVDSVRGSSIRDGVNIVLVGEPNVGKSSLLNFLAHRDVAIVSEIPGTTRDAIEVQLDISGIPVVFTDTAGLRTQPTDLVEKQGIERTLQKSLAADIVVWIVESSQNHLELPVKTNAKIVKVTNKIDRENTKTKNTKVDLQKGAMRISVETGEGLNEFLAHLGILVDELFGGKEPAIITRQRQKDAMRGCIKHVDAAIEMDGRSLELSAEQIRLASIELSRLVGRVDVEDLLDVIFSDFCVGK